LFEFSSFLVDNVCKELLLKTLLCDNEVYNGTLGGYLWGRVRILHLGLEIELEVQRIIDIVSSQGDLESSTRFCDGSLEKRVESGVNIFFELFEHDDLTKGNGEFEVHHPTFLVEGNN
jgi:hypothetical protein